MPDFLGAHTALLAAVGLLLWRIARNLYIGFTGPLTKIPGPWLNRISYWPLKIAVITGRRMTYVNELHSRYGPIVRISPDEVAVADLAATKDIHRIGSGFIKAPWYGKFTGQDVPEHNKGIFAMRDAKIHAARRRLLSNPFAKSSILEWETIVHGKVHMAIDGIKRSVKEVGKADILAWLTFMANDVICTLSFGDSTKALETGEKTQYMLDLEFVMKSSGLSLELPLLRPILSYLSPRGRLGQHGRSMIKRSQHLKASGQQDHGTIFSRMIQQGEDGVLTPMQIGLEATGLVIAGSDTTAVSATYLIWAMLSNPDADVECLRAEVNGLPNDFVAEDTMKLPYLNCVVQETLRLYGAAPGGLPRTTPSQGAVLCGLYIPADVTVTTQAYTLHRNPDIYEDPLVFKPQRWLNPTQAMRDAYMPFGAGTRVCIGVHLAMLELCLASTTFFRECGDFVLDRETTAASMEQENYFLAAPRSHRCFVTAHP